MSLANVRKCVTEEDEQCWDCLRWYLRISDNIRNHEIRCYNRNYHGSLSLSLSLPLSLSLSLSHTHSLILSLSLPLSLSHTYTLTLYFSHSLSPFFSLTVSHSLSVSLTLSLIFSLSLVHQLGSVDCEGDLESGARANVLAAAWAAAEVTHWSYTLWSNDIIPPMN